MKRKFFYLAVSALALSACTSEDVVNDVTKSRSVIQFENVVNKATRSDDLSSGNLSLFHVFGYYTTPENPQKVVSIFWDTPVEYSIEETKWEIKKGGDRYWVPNATYYFYAYSCGSVSKLNKDFGTFAMDTTDNKQFSDRVLFINNYICDDEHQHDLIYAEAQGSAKADGFTGIVAGDKDNPVVAFKFRHILSKVKVNFVSTFPSDYEVHINDISLENIRNSGTFNPDGNHWSPVIRRNEIINNVYFLSTVKGDAPLKTDATNKDGVTTEDVYVIPYNYSPIKTGDSNETGVTLKFNLKVYNKGALVLNKILTGKFNPTWDAGYQYVYNVELNGDAANLETIKFDSTKIEVSKWQDGKDESNISTK